jgi:hypothetical protein
LTAPGGNPDAERFLPLRSGGSTSSRMKALLTDENRISMRP